MIRTSTRARNSGRRSWEPFQRCRVEGLGFKGHLGLEPEVLEDEDEEEESDEEAAGIFGLQGLSRFIPND